MTMADRIVVMRDGVVEQAGLPLDLYDPPGDLCVAGFIGSPAMNLFKGSIRGDRGPSFMTRRGAWNSRLRVGAERIEWTAWHIWNPPRAPALGGGPMKAEVSVVEPTGSETQVFAKVGGKKDRRRLP